MNKQYIVLINELKQSIIQSRYAAARLANREQLLLYYKTGKMLAERIAAEKWGAKILEQIAEDLQKQLPGLRGFSFKNLKNMRRFYNEYQSITIGQSVTAQIRKVRSNTSQGQITNDELSGVPDAFFNISFTHHLVILSKCAATEERLFYITEAASQF